MFASAKASAGLSLLFRMISSVFFLYPTTIDARGLRKKTTITFQSQPLQQEHLAKRGRSCDSLQCDFRWCSPAQCNGRLDECFFILRQLCAVRQVQSAGRFPRVTAYNKACFIIFERCPDVTVNGMLFTVYSGNPSKY